MVVLGVGCSMVSGQTFPMLSDLARAFYTHALALAFYRQCQREGRIVGITPRPRYDGGGWVVHYSRI